MKTLALAASVCALIGTLWGAMVTADTRYVRSMDFSRCFQ
jgi:hypothetical protein